MGDWLILTGTVDELWTTDPDYAGVKVKASGTGLVHNFMLWGPDVEGHDDVSPLQDGAKLSLLRDAFINGNPVEIIYWSGKNYAHGVRSKKA